jgi:hypothetical protein
MRPKVPDFVLSSLLEPPGPIKTQKPVKSTTTYSLVGEEVPADETAPTVEQITIPSRLLTDVVQLGRVRRK